MALPKKHKPVSSAEESVAKPDPAPILNVTPDPKETPMQQVESAMHAFDDGISEADDALAPFSVSALGTAFETVVRAIENNFIPEYEIRKILDVLPVQQESQNFDANFDLSHEISTQLVALKSIRNKIFASDGQIKEGQTVRDAKDFMASSSQLLQMLQKSRAELINTERLQAIEEATIECIKELDEDAVKDFLANLKEKLDRIN